LSRRELAGPMMERGPVTPPGRVVSCRANAAGMPAGYTGRPRFKSLRPSSDNCVVTLDQVIAALVKSENGAADDALLEALRVGTAAEAGRALDGLFQRGTAAGMSGVVERYADLPAELRPAVVAQMDRLDTAVRECGRAGDTDARRSAVRLVADARCAPLAYVLADNLRHGDLSVAMSASAALVGLAEWIVAGVRALQRGAGPGDPAAPRLPTYEQIIQDRPDVEQAVVRAVEQQRERPATDRVAQDVLRAAVLLCDSPASRLVNVLRGPRHAGQAVLARRLSQPPAADAVDAFLVAAAHGGQRTTFGNALARIVDAPALDALVRRTHWLKDQALATCMSAVSRGAWWTDADLLRDTAARHGEDVARVGRWIAASGTVDAVQDDRLIGLREQLLSLDPDNVAARADLLRLGAARPRGASVALVVAFLNDPDERLSRMAAREIQRRRPTDFKNILMTRLGTAPASARRVIGRAVGQPAFEQFWANFDRMDAAGRRASGRALLKMLPDMPQRLNRRIAGLVGTPAVPVFDRLKALQMVADLGCAREMAGTLIRLCADASPRVRSKAVALLGQVPAASLDALVERLLNDPDARVRANAVEVLEDRQAGREAAGATFVPTLVQRARTGSNRERANAIRALHRLRMDDVADALQQMLADARPEHRVSALWAVRETGLWNLAGRVGQIAKSDPDGHVRQYAVGVLRTASELLRRGQQQSRLAG
jgi:hypothetical protein